MRKHLKVADYFGYFKKNRGSIIYTKIVFG